MKLRSYHPCKLLRPFIKAYLIIESEDGMENNLLPDTSVVMAFRFRGRISHTLDNTGSDLPFSVISGLRKSPRQVRYAANAATFLVKFQEGGVPAFLSLPTHELFGQIVSLDHFAPRAQLNEIEDLLCEAADHRQRVVIVERFLRTLFHPAPSDPLIAKAIKQIEHTRGTLSIRKLLAGFPISRDPFEKRFRRVTGTSPKQFSAIVRMRNVITAPRENNLTATALSAGYFDQAHFIKDFRQFTGTTPKAFFRSARYW
ncbi:helix-turn-helix domain-containing protein [Sinomicrobium weinanense]|uniref:Helix-turn-helix transcriptional regulator n=1 Tax=Sinomicrobium weinanense TaxID=2842200 RepID=A0A926Q2B4_9FLAO|nr:AraC family transcriptional regulator [Sinomicrobium weinanense]MBC9794726.1 helix-turn-helix transcriptional regulator [Sinomicrobium weinanense]MBU3124985.1 AraC family transcriptional regulator [Sinomicrobium weinanense]